MWKNINFWKAEMMIVLVSYSFLEKSDHGVHCYFLTFFTGIINVIFFLICTVNLCLSYCLWYFVIGLTKSSKGFIACTTLSLLAATANILCKQFGTRSGLTKCRAWYGSKLLDTLMIFKKNCFEKVNLKSTTADDKKAWKITQHAKE